MTAPASPFSRPQADAVNFPLLWTVALSGHRDLPDESKAREAIRAQLSILKSEAVKQEACLVAVSSLARGADLIFAEECLAASVPWKCLLPFPEEEFQKDDFTPEEGGRLVACLAGAYRVECVSARIPKDEEARKKAYQECGHRTVEAGDVVLILSDEEKTAKIAGAVEMTAYARDLRKPIWHWHTGTGEIKQLGWPGDSGERAGHPLFRSRVTPLMIGAAKMPEPIPVYPEAPDDTPKSDRHRNLEALFRRIDDLALQKQGDAQKMMERVVRAHLLATTAAALSVTVLAGSYRALLPENLRWLAIIGVVLFSLLVLAKPLLAALALWLENRLHKFRSREHWVEARVAAELCRSAGKSWRFPQAPLAVFSEEDFPHFKRLIRTLRLARELDAASAATLSEEDAFTRYTEERIDDQIHYFRRQHGKAVKENKRWQRHFNIATWTVIILGTLFGFAEAADACLNAGIAPGALHEGGFSHWLHLMAPPVVFVLIVAPFYASYALAVLAIRDCRRRCDRFKNMHEFLERQKDRLTRIKSPSSRIAVIENTERMLLEELHEWYSVMRAVRV